MSRPSEGVRLDQITPTQFERMETDWEARKFAEWEEQHEGRYDGGASVALPDPWPTRTSAEDLALCGCGHTIARHTVACWSCDCGRTEGELLAQLRRERAA